MVVTMRAEFNTVGGGGKTGKRHAGNRIGMMLI